MYSNCLLLNHTVLYSICMVVHRMVMLCLWYGGAGGGAGGEAGEAAGRSQCAPGSGAHRREGHQ